MGYAEKEKETERRDASSDLESSEEDLGKMNTKVGVDRAYELKCHLGASGSPALPPPPPPPPPLPIVLT